MSTALAIAATSRVLASMLDEHVTSAKLETVLGTPTTTALAPDRVV